MSMVIAFGFPFGWEWIVILAVVLLLFGHRIPSMARSLGSGITEFKKGLRGENKESLPPPSDSGPAADSSPAKENQEA